MRFSMVDRVLEQSEDHLVAVRALSSGEEYLRDHFEGFPVMPGVLMLEAMVQAARLLLVGRDERYESWVLGSARGIRYSSMVRPGQILRIEVSLTKLTDSQGDFRGTGQVLDPGSSDGPAAVSGKLSLREARVGGLSGVGGAVVTR